MKRNLFIASSSAALAVASIAAPIPATAFDLNAERKAVQHISEILISQMSYSNEGYKSIEVYIFTRSGSKWGKKYSCVDGLIDISWNNNFQQDYYYKSGLIRSIDVNFMGGHIGGCEINVQARL